MSQTAPQTLRPPVFLGCAALVGAVVLVVLIVAFGLIFLNSGADHGTVVLNDAADYAPGSEQYISAHNFFIVRLGDGSFVALADLDAANRTNTSRQCRVAPVLPGDASLPGLISTLSSRMSPLASGSTLVFREDCFNAVYDITGTRLDKDAPNLDRFATSIDSSGRLNVDLAKRSCSQRSGADLALPISCR